MPGSAYTLGSVAEITRTSGTGSYLLAGRLPGSVAVEDLIPDGTQATWSVSDGNQTEILLGTYDSGTGTISRDTILYPLSGAISWSSYGRRVISLSIGSIGGIAAGGGLYWDSVNGRLGVRTNTPDVHVDIDGNIIRWGLTGYPAQYGFLNGPNTYLIGDAGDTSSDVSLVMRTAGNARWEAGMVGAVTDSVINQSYRIKSITGTYLSEIFTDRFVISDSLNPRYPFVDIYPAPSESAKLRVYGSGSEVPMLVIGNSNGEASPTGSGSGLEISYDASDIGRITAITHDAFYRDIVIEANNFRIGTGPVFLNVDAVVVNSQGAVIVGDAIQKAASATVSNSGDAGLALMSGYVPGTSVLTATGGTGTHPTFNVTESQISRVNSIAAAGTGGTNSTATTLTAAAALGALTITVASIAGFANGDQIDIALAAGGYHHTTINGAPSGNTITLLAALPSAANNGANVYEGRLVTGTTGTGTKFVVSVRVSGGGIAEVLKITTRGIYTVNPTSLTAEPVTGSSLTGAQLNISMGALTTPVATAGSLTEVPTTPTSTTATGGGTGATLFILYQNSVGTINLSDSLYDDGTPPTGTLGSGYVRAASPTLTGVPLAPTAVSGTNTTQIATTAFVISEVATGGLTGTPGSVFFAGGAGTPAEDNANFFYNDSTNTLEIAAGLVDNGAGAQAIINFADGGSNKFGIFKAADNSFAIYDYVNSANVLYIGTGGGVILGGFLGLQIGTPTGGAPASGSVNVDGHVYDDGTIPTGTAGSGYVRANSPTLVTPNLGAANGTSLITTGLIQAGTTLGISTDVLLNRTGANSLALRNGGSPQTLRVYDSFTDASNGEWGEFFFTSGQLIFGTNQNGSGIAQAMQIRTGGVAAIRIDDDQNISFSTAAPSTHFEVLGTYTTTNANYSRIQGTHISSNTGIQQGFIGSTTFNPSGASIGGIYSFNGSATISGSALTVPVFLGFVTQLVTGAGYTGSVTDASSYFAFGPSIGGSNPFATYSAFNTLGIVNGNNLAAGTVTNRGLNIESITAGAAGGTINNYGARVVVPSGGASSGTVNNRGIYITGNGGVAAGGTVNNYALLSDSTAPFQISGVFRFLGSTSAEPMLKRSGTVLEHRLADDSAYGPMAASELRQYGGENGQFCREASVTELTTIAAAATTTTTIQIPAGAIVIGVSVRVTTVIPTAASFSVGVVGFATRYGTGISTAATTTNRGTNDGLRFYAAAVGILITPNLTPAANSGRVRVTIHYIEITPPTS